ncbi:MAG: hypothetical protein ACRDIC_23235 [bacterium]
MINYTGRTVLDRATGEAVAGSGIERLHLHDDKSFRTELQTGQQVSSTSGEWRLVRDADGNQLLALRRPEQTTPAAGRSLLDSELVIKRAPDLGSAERKVLCFPNEDLNLCLVPELRKE